MSNHPDTFTNGDLNRFWGDAPEWLGPYFREIEKAQSAVAIAYAAAIDAFESRGIEVTDDFKQSLAQVIADIPYAATISARDTIEENGGGDAPALDALLPEVAKGSQFFPELGAFVKEFYGEGE